MENKLVLIDTTPLVNTTTGNAMTKQTQTYFMGDQKFQIRFIHANGYTGNNDKALYVYSKLQERWNFLEDISTLGMGEVPSYYSPKECADFCQQFFKKMEARIKKIYY